MNKEKQTLLAAFRGQIVSGVFTKQDGSMRNFWGVLKRDDNVADHILVTYDMALGQYRRFDMRLPYAIANKATVGSTILTDTVAPAEGKGRAIAHALDHYDIAWADEAERQNNA